MRKVLVTTYETKEGFKRYIPSTIEDYKVIQREGLFHQFAQAGDEGSIEPVAIIEFPDGSVEMIWLGNFKFTKGLSHD